MSIIRAPRLESNYCIVDKRNSENPGLSWAARGLHTFLVGKPDNWKVSIEHLSKQTSKARIKTGRDGIYALLAELQGAGYVTTTRKRDRGGRLGENDYIVSETPFPAQPDVAKPEQAAPHPAETTLTSNKEALRIEEKTKNDSTKRAKAEVALTRTLGKGDLQWPEDFDLDSDVVDDFRKHCEELGKSLTASAWKQVIQKLQDLYDKGVDLNESLRCTMLGRWVIPVDPSRGKQAKIDRRQDAKQRQVDQDARWSDRALPPGVPDSAYRPRGAALVEALP